MHLQVPVLWGSPLCSAARGAVLTLPPCPHRFIQQVNLAAVTIQRWYRRHSQRHRTAAAALGRLMAAKREVGPVPCSVARTTQHPCPTGHAVGVPLVPRAGLRKSKELWLCMVQRAGEVPVPSELCWLCPGIGLCWVPAGAEAQRLSTHSSSSPSPLTGSSQTLAVAAQVSQKCPCLGHTGGQRRDAPSWLILMNP